MRLFSSNLETIIFASLVLIWVAYEVINSGIIPAPLHDGRAINRKTLDNGSNMLLRVALYVSIIIAIALAIKNIALLPGWLFYPGILLMVIGMLVRQWAVHTLGHFFTFAIGVQNSHKVVDSGPYRYVRHPSYLGMSLIVIGIDVSLRSLGGILAILVLYGLAIGYRIHVEEKFLVSELGDDYVRYAKRTKRLIPFIY